ncbi:UGT80B1 [Symbiodinium natans]|uniref:UGT80B1 protein n=1 Tax=Symbiodinium natans TaxID=878477 RepID=A0A812L5H6_9DINO|nr:UGT80B1 [Symbiodinium natans]
MTSDVYFVPPLPIIGNGIAADPYPPQALFETEAMRIVSKRIARILQSLTVISVKNASASKAIDKVRILNTICKRSSLDGDPPETSPHYDEVDSGLRAIFALSALPICAKRGLQKELGAIADVLRQDTREREALNVNLGHIQQNTQSATRPMERVLLISLGSRGDMEPFLALGEELQMAGHAVAFCMPAQFEGLATEVSQTFYAMDKAYLELVENDDVRRVIGQVGSAFSRLRASIRLLHLRLP